MLSAIKRIVIGAVRLPLDLLFFTIDFGRAVRLRVVRRWFRKDRVCPFCYSPGTEPSEARPCLSALKYANRGFFRGICPGVSTGRDDPEGMPRCARANPYADLGGRLLPIGLVLVLLWGGGAVLLEARFGLLSGLGRLALAGFAPAAIPATAVPQETQAELEARLRALSVSDPRTDKDMAERYLQQADEHFAVGGYRLARLEYAIALRRDPDLAAAYRGLGLCHIEAGDFAAAESPLHRALELNPEDPKATLALAEVAAALGRNDEALDYARQVLEADPGNVSGFLRLMHFYQALGNAEAGVRAGEEALAAAPDDLEALHASAVLLNLVGRPDQARPLLRRCLGLRPDHVDALTTLAAVEFADGNKDEGLALLDRVAVLDPDSLPLQAMRAEVQGMEDGVRAAIQAYEALVDQHPTYHAAANRLADLYLRTRQFDPLYELAERLATQPDPVTSARGNLWLARLWLGKGFYALAIETASKAATESQHGAGARFILAQAHLARKEFANALNHLESLHQAYPTHEAIHLMLVRALLGLNRTQEAETTYQQLLAQHPESSAAIQMMGNYYFQSQDLAKAEAAYQEALRLNPENIHLRYDLGMLLAQRSQGLARSEALALQMKQQHPESALYYDVLGWVYYQQGRPEDAVDLLSQAAAAAPHEPLFHYHLGAALAANNQPATAQKHLTTALNISTNFFGHEHARELLEQLVPQ